MNTLSIKIISLNFLLFFLYGSAIAQESNTAYPVDEETGLITYKDVVEEIGNKEEFFNRAIGWINEYYKNPVDVTKVRDPKTGVIKGLHRFKIKETNEDGLQTDAGVVQYRFLLEFKEGRYRYTLTEFVLRQSSKIPTEKWLNDADPKSKSYLTQLDEFAQSWIKSLKKGMQPKVEKNDDDW